MSVLNEFPSNNAFNEHQQLQDISSSKAHPFDDFLEAMTRNDWDFASHLMGVEPTPVCDMDVPPSTEPVPTEWTSEYTDILTATVSRDASPVQAPLPEPAPISLDVPEDAALEPPPLPLSLLEDPLLPSLPLTLPEETPAASPKTVLNVPVPTAPSMTYGAPTSAPPTIVHNAYSIYGNSMPPKAVKGKRGHRRKKPDVVQYVDEPTEVDVLLGRGGRSNHWVGNKRYRSEVENLQTWYKSSAKAEKTDLSQCLVSYVDSYGGRFLKLETTNRWYVVSNIIARRKASQALREHATPEERAAKRVMMAAGKAS